MLAGDQATPQLLWSKAARDAAILRRLLPAGQLTVPAPEFRPSGRIGSVDAPEFVPGAGSWRSGSIGSANAAEAMPSWAAGNTAFAAPTLPSSLCAFRSALCMQRVS